MHMGWGNREDHVWQHPSLALIWSGLDSRTMSMGIPGMGRSNLNDRMHYIYPAARLMKLGLMYHQEEL